MARKQPSKKLGLEDALALLRERYIGRLAPPLEGLARPKADLFFPRTNGCFSTPFCAIVSAVSRNRPCRVFRPGPALGSPLELISRSWTITSL